MFDVIDAAYLVSCATTAFTSVRSESQSNACRWLTVSIGLLVLLLLRTAEAGVWVDDYLRSGLHLLNWYDDRRPLQLAFITTVTLILLVAFRRLSVGSGLPLICATCAFCALAIAMAIRSSSFHWTDAAFQQQIGSLSVSHLIQIVALLATSAAALSSARMARSSHNVI